MKDFTPSELETHLKHNHPLMLDVREQWEWDKCHFDKARLLPMGEIMTSLDNPPLDKSEETVLICHHGIRSMQAVATESSKSIIVVTADSNTTSLMV
ncbi:rhodanese [Isorropodon fossajaponicum endosymbiont JTNG4]|uniref:rhodanese-like domain-containing protein n=1 Tax=Isorropodon fossajaponicum symbiont TaxID=883811 RepID=UPI001916A1C1|nr:rhodanese-like domain-containing protein [Isorropodon fossajaponicum symbiont]BBB24228.1 rhodanese [Isorropodon fossajaponicum endosymbiont JTNG4]